eukprot:5694194-Alexandrium_andersonii.AAC.1
MSLSGAPSSIMPRPLALTWLPLAPVTQRVSGSGSWSFLKKSLGRDRTASGRTCRGRSWSRRPRCSRSP